MAINYQGGNDVVVTGAFAPMMKTLQQNYLYEREKRAQDEKEANTLKLKAQQDLAKINPNGIWEGDAKLVGKTYDEIKELNFQMEKARTPEEKRMKSLEIQGKATELTNLIANSKEFKKGWLDQYNRVPTQIGKMDTSKAVSYLDSAKGKSSTELGSDYLTGVNNFFYKYDPTKVDSAVSKVATDLLKNVPEQRALANTVTGSGGRRTDIWNVTKTANETQVLEQLSRLAKGGNRDVQSYVEGLMSNNNVDFNTAVGMLAEEFSPKFSTQSTSETSADKSKGITINMPNPFGSNTEKGQAIERNAKLFTFRDDKGNVVGEYTAPSAMALNKTQSLSGVIEGRDPYTGQRVRLDNPKNAEVFGIFEDNQGRKLMQVRITDEYGDEQVIISPNTQRINRAELSKKELQYLQGYEADVKERKSSTPQQTNNKQSSNKPKFN